MQHPVESDGGVETGSHDAHATQPIGPGVNLCHTGQIWLVVLLYLAHKAATIYAAHVLLILQTPECSAGTSGPQSERDSIMTSLVYCYSMFIHVL